MRSLILLPLLLVGGCAMTPAQTARAAQDAEATQTRLAAALDGLTPEKPSQCIPVGRQSTQITSYGPTILYRVDRNLVYRTDTSGGCEHAGETNNILVTVSNTGRLCSGDMARTVDNNSGIQTGACALGEFTTYRRVRK